MNVLIVVDMQKDFIDGALGTPEAVAIVPAVRAKLAQAKASGDAVIFTRDTHGEDYLTTLEGQNLPVRHCIAGTPGWQIESTLPTDGARLIDKPTFGSAALGRYLTELAPARVELVGLCTDICVISNALLVKAFLPQTPVAVDAACCAGVTPARHRTALEAMACCQIEIVNA